MTRTLQPTDDILDVAAVVLGEERITLIGWQFSDVVAAMTALGYSTQHIAYSMNRTEESVRKRAQALHIRVNRYDQRPDWFAVDMVATGAACMHLLNIDRIEAIRVMAARDIDSAEMARRLCTDPHNVRTLASRNGIRITRDAAGWDRMRRNQPARRRQRQAVAA